MALATGIAAASIYFNQPMLGLIQQDFPASHVAGMIPTVTQLGYAAGLFFLVPLGDLVERRRLIVGQFVILALALALVAWSQGVGMLLVASVLVGICATVAQQILPFAAHLAAPARRGAVVGTVMAGLLGGILLSRTVAGLVAAHFGWRAIFFIAIPFSLAMAALLARILPSSRPEGGLNYGRLMVSMIGLWREFPELRRAAATQAMLFGGFSVFWTILALYLETPRYGYGPEVAGLFGIVGMVGVLAAPQAGRIADRIGPHAVVLCGAVVTLVAWLVFGFWTGIAGLVVGVILLDFGVQSAMVSNQHIIFSLRPEARARLNTVFVTVLFLGGSFGSASAAVAWAHGGWAGVTVLGIVLALIAAALQLVGARRRRA
ncbi:MFS transporter [Thioclava sp. BHET1]|nr:MFS transporter [Thioclava sp. BHET1]